MTHTTIKKTIKIVTIVWILGGALIAGAVASGLIAKDLFQWIFAGGFVIYAVVVTILTKMLMDEPQ